jgi:Flp pilus assembly protein CpaB
MEARKLVFPVVLAMMWVVMAAMAMVDFASFSAATQTAQAQAAATTTQTPLVAAAPLQVF